MGLKMKKWIAYKNGQFGAVYHGDEIEYGDDVINESTPDQTLFTIGILRLKEIPPEFPDLPRYVVQGPIYEFAGDGVAEVTERFVYRYETLQEIRDRKINEWYLSKDNLLREGVTYKGARYDLRFRNISYLALLASLITNDQYPENFDWFDGDGNVVPLSKEDCLGLIKEATAKIVQLEAAATKMLKKIEGITDVHELIKTEIVLKEE